VCMPMHIDSLTRAHRGGGFARAQSRDDGDGRSDDNFVYRSCWIDRQHPSHYVPESRIRWGLLRMSPPRAAAWINRMSRDFMT
jgi:hypothetical protein